MSSSGTRKKANAAQKNKKSKTTFVTAEGQITFAENVEHFLDHGRFFSHKEGMQMYADDMAMRNIVHPTIVDLDFFKSSSLHFHELLSHQGLDHFISMKLGYYTELIKVFYANLHIKENGELCSEVMKVKIRVRPRDWLTLCSLKYQGQKMHYPNIEEFDQYDQNQALAAMTRPDIPGHPTKYVDCLTIEDRLLHYIYVKALKP